MSQFTLFPYLPQELQDAVWDAAIRDDGPAAQFFTIYNPQRDRNAIVPRARRVEDANNSNGQSCRLGLAAPQPARYYGVHSWVDRNASAYMTDSGLWTACWASRQRMLWHFKPTETSALMSTLAPVGRRTALEICRRPTASVTMPFRRDNGEQQYLTIQPMEDLLVFQFPVNRQGTPPARKHYWKFLKDFPPFRWQRRGGGWHSPLHVRNIAVPYMPQGMDDIVCPTARDINGLEGFWFVDYALQRRYQVHDNADRRDRQIFHVGGDWEFVEVRDTDEEWWDSTYAQTGTRSYDPITGNDTYAYGPFSSGAFISAADLQWEAMLTEAALNFQQSVTGNHWNTPGTDQASTDSVDNGEDNGEIDSGNEEVAVNANKGPSFPRIGVLACVKRGSEKHLPTINEWIDRRRREST